MCRALSVWAALVAVMTVTVAQEPFTVMGRVVTPDGKPAAKAQVWLVVQRGETEPLTVEARGQTDKGGNFFLPVKPPLRISFGCVIAHHPNFAIGWQNFDPRSPKPLTIRLNAPAPLAGVVFSSDGQPLAGAKVQVAAIFDAIPRRAFEPGRQERAMFQVMPEAIAPLVTTTDERGRFAFRHLPAKTEVFLKVHPPNSPASRLFPSLDEWHPLPTGTVDIVLVVSPSGTLTGQVLAEGKPVANAKVICRTALHSVVKNEQQFVTDADGRFAGELMPTRWLVAAQTDDGQWQSTPQHVVVNPNESVTVTLHLARAVEVRGVVKDAATRKPVPFAKVLCGREVRLANEPPMWWEANVVRTDEQGCFRLTLLPGKWHLWAWAPYASDRSAPAEVEVKDAPIEVGELLLRPLPSVQVQVVDERGKPVPRAIVTNEWTTVQADEQGQAKFSTRAPRPLWAASPDRTMFGSATLTPDSTSVRIVVRKGVPVSGQVTDERGKPIPHARVLVCALRRDENLPFEMHYEWFEVTTDAQGRYRLFLPPNQKFVLIAGPPDGIPVQTKPFTLTAGKPVAQNIKVPAPDFAIEGIVVDEETGEPIWGALVAISVQVGFYGYSRVAFTDLKGRFSLKGLRREALSEVVIMHPLYETLRSFPGELPQGRIRLLRRRLHVTPQQAIGKPTPPLSDIRWLKGEAPSLQGKTTYLLFALPYDPACERVLQRLKEEQAKNPDKVQVIVVFDAALPADELRRYVQELSLPFHCGTVPEGRRSGWDSATFQRYGVTAVPMLVVIDEQGIVRAINPE